MRRIQIRTRLDFLKLFRLLLLALFVPLTAARPPFTVSGAPKVLSVSPASGSTSAPPASVVVTFDAPIDPLSVSNTTVVLTGRGPDLILGTADDVVVTPTTLSVTGAQVTLDLTGQTLPNGSYRLRISGRPPAPPTFSGLYGHWLLNEGSGTQATDTSGNGRHGTLNGAAWDSGLFGPALRLNGGGEHVDLNAGLLTPSWTAAFWVLRSANVTSIAATLLDGAVSAGGTSVRLEQFTTDQVGMTEYGITDEDYGYTAPFDTWIHLAFSSDGSNARLHVNGSLAYTSARTYNLGLSKIGTGAVLTTKSFNGRMNDLQVYSRVLSGTEISALATLTGCVKGTGGEVIDGEFSASFPSGDSVAGGDFNAYFGVNSPAPSQPFVLLSPPDGATGVGFTPTFMWNASAGALSYTLQVAKDPAFVSKVVNVSGLPGLSHAPGMLTPGTLYYWRVIAVSGGGGLAASGSPFSFTAQSIDLSAGGCGGLGLEMLLVLALVRLAQKRMRRPRPKA